MIVVAVVFIAYKGFRSSHREALHDHEFMTNAGNRASRPMCTSGTSKSNRTDQQAKTRAIEHAPIDLTSRRPTPDAIHVTGGSLPGHPPRSFHLRLPYLFSHHPAVSSRRKTRARRLPRFPRIDVREIESPHTAESGRPTANVPESFVNRPMQTGFLSLPMLPSFLLRIHYATRWMVEKRGPKSINARNPRVRAIICGRTIDREPGCQVF